MSKLKVAALQGLSASSDAITLANDGTCTANITNNLSNRNLIINGAMQVAQRGTSYTGTDTYATVDRFRVGFSGLDENLTQAQVDVASGTTPYALGFRKAYRITNGNQTSGFGVGDQIRIDTLLEAQDFANSGWNYTSASSYITLSYWVKSSVAQEFFGYLYTADSPNYKYGWSLGSLSADTWTKVTKKIPGNSNLVFNNDNGQGCWLNLLGIWGTNYTASDATSNTWMTWDGAKRSTDQASTWYTTNDATFEITGVQLEVGDHATDFEHRSYGDELARCQRYFYMHANGEFALSNTDRCPIGMGYGYTSTSGFVMITFPTQMRTNPSLYKVVGTDYFNFAYNNNNGYPNDISANRMSSQVCELGFHTGSSWDQNASGMFRTYNTAARVGFSAEL